MNITMPAAPKKTRSPRLFIVIALLVVAALAVAYWFSRGFITLDDARLLHADVQLNTQGAGTIAAVAVKVGQRVKKGDVLFSFDPQSAQDEIAKASAELSAIAATLPPEALQLVAMPNGVTSQQSLEDAIEVRRAEEKESRKKVEQASAAQAKATYEVNKAQVQRSRGRITAEQLADIQAQREEADAVMVAAKAAFERVSLARAGVEEKLQNLRNLAQRSGSGMSVSMRIRAYEGQMAVLQAAQGRLANTTVRCPQDGVVSELFIAQGSYLSSGQSYMRLGLVGDIAPLVVGYTSAKEASRIHKGQPCKVAVSGLGNFTGVVESTALVAEPPFPPARSEPAKTSASEGYFMMDIRLDTTTTYEFAVLPELSLATVSVLLSE